jgi:hypothetical protein
MTAVQPELETLDERGPAAGGDNSSVRAARRGGVLTASWAPLAAGLVAAGVQWLVWRSLTGVPVFTDEASYLLQAKLFAALRWTAPAAPIREFFEQGHVIISPVIASKYPPGHALLLAIGMFFGLPGLMPLALTGLTAGLLFATTRRLINGEVALLAWLVWTFAPVPIGFRPSYFSETTSAATWVAGWWALVRWRDDPRTRWLVLVTVFTAWCAITRPVTAVAYAIPTAAVTMALIWRRRAWRAMTIALCAGFAVIALLPLWNWRTTGNVKQSPYVAYNEVYIPYEHLGFGDNGKHTPTWLPKDLYEQFAMFEPVHRDYTPATFVTTAKTRAYYIWYWAFGRDGWTAMLSVFLLLGAVVGGVAGGVAAGSVLSLYVVYLAYAHTQAWTLYYYEALAPMAFLIALGVARAIGVVVAPGTDVREALGRPRTRKVTLGVALACIPFALATTGRGRLEKMQMTAAQTVFERAAERLPTPAIVFVRYAPDHYAHTSLIANDGDLVRSPLWRVYDRGPSENAKLRALAPERHAFVYDEASRRMLPLP